MKWKKRDPKSHKGQNGRLLVIGGSNDYIGSPALAALSAMRAGCDRVTVAAPQAVAWTINAMSPDFITCKLSGKCISSNHLDELLILSGRHDAVVLGGGIGRDARTRTFVKEFCRKNNKPLVLDADALAMIKIQNCRDTLFTPHRKEFQGLLGSSGLSEDNVMGSLGTNVLLLKGPTDMIMSSKDIKGNETGNPSMTKAGTGDVLAGLAGAFIAQGYGLFDSACRAAFIAGKAGDLLEKESGCGYLAKDLADSIPKIMKGAGAWK